ncbi:MAG: glycosyltransferase family 87 protein [Paracoccaceae bacterium]
MTAGFMGRFEDKHFRWIGYLSIGLVLLFCGAAFFLLNRGMYWDFANYYDAGQKVLAGQFNDLYDPFAKIDGQPPLSNMSFLSAPLTSVLYAPLALLEPASALVAFKVQSAVCYLVGLSILYFHLRRFVSGAPSSMARFFACFWTAALVFQPFWTVYVVGGQVTPFVFMLFVVALVQITRDKMIAAGAIWILCVAIKPAFAPGLVFLFVVLDNRFRASVLAFGSAAVLVSLGVFGVEPHLVLVARVLEESRNLNPAYFNSNMFAWLEPLWLSGEELNNLDFAPPGLKLVSTTLRLAVIAGLVLVYYRIRKSAPSPRAGRHVSVVFALVTPLVLTPIAWAHYLSVLFIPLMYVLADENSFSRSARVLVAIIVAVSLFQNLLLWQIYIHFFEVVTKGEYLAAGLVRSLPMLLTVALLFVWAPAFQRSYGSSAWRTRDGESGDP